MMWGASSHPQETADNTEWKRKVAGHSMEKARKWKLKEFTRTSQTSPEMKE
jgi:hypothetical protein